MFVTMNYSNGRNVCVLTRLLSGTVLQQKFLCNRTQNGCCWKSQFSLILLHHGFFSRKCSQSSSIQHLPVRVQFAQFGKGGNSFLRSFGRRHDVFSLQHLGRASLKNCMSVLLFSNAINDLKGITLGENFTKALTDASKFRPKTNLLVSVSAFSGPKMMIYFRRHSR